MTEIKTRKIIFRRKGKSDDIWTIDKENDKGTVTWDGETYEFRLSELPDYVPTPIMFRKEDLDDI